MTRKSLYARRVAGALGFSIGLHAALGLALSRSPLAKFQEAPAMQEAPGPLRLSGGTFEVEAFEDSAGSPPEAAPSAANAGDVESEPESAAESESEPEPESEPTSVESSPPPAQVPTPAPPPAPAAPSERQESAPAPPPSAAAAPSPSPAPTTAPKPPATPPSSPARTPAADPFDLALPASASSSSGNQGAPSSAQVPGGSYGEEGAPSTVVDLHAAFLKTLPLAAKADNAWTILPLGEAGSVVIKLTIDASLKLAPVTVFESAENQAPAHLKRMAIKNRDWLHTQRFSIGPQSQSGTQLLRITAVISQKSPDADTPDAAGTQALGTRGGTSPTGAYFTYFSGRHVEFKVEKLGSASSDQSK